MYIRYLLVDFAKGSKWWQMFDSWIPRTKIIVLVRMPGLLGSNTGVTESPQEQNIEKANDTGSKNGL